MRVKVNMAHNTLGRLQFCSQHENSVEPLKFVKGLHLHLK